MANGPQVGDPIPQDATVGGISAGMPIPSDATIGTQAQGTPPPTKRTPMDSVKDFGGALWNQINPVGAIQGAAQLVAHPWDTYYQDAVTRQGILDKSKASFKAGNPGAAAVQGLYGFLPFLGPQMENAGEDIYQGRIAKGLGSSVGMGLAASAPAAIGPAGDLIGKGRSAIAKSMYTPEGDLVPGAKVAGQLTGAAAGTKAGALVGHPWAGGIAGWESGPYFLKKMFPESSDAATARAALENEADTEAATKQAEREARSAGINAPGPWTPQAARAAYKASQVTPETPDPLAQQKEIGSFMNKGYKSMVEPPKPAPTIVPKMSTAAEPSFSGSEGRAATWNNDDVMRIAATGNREAIQQKILRGLPLSDGERYIMGDPDYSRAVYNPRETTTFGPDDTNIRNMQKEPPSSRKRIALPWESRQ